MRSIVASSLASLLAIGTAWGAEDKASSPQLHCGAYCLYLGLKALDLPLKDYKELEDKLGQPSSLGYSMEQLAEAARGFGAHALGVETSLENLRLRPNRFACIALLKEGHFVNVYDVTNDRVFLVDPPGTRQAGLDGFRAIWTGKALLISDRPIPDESSLRRRYAWLRAPAIALAALALAGGIYYAAARKKKVGALLIALLMGTIQGCQRANQEALNPKLPAILVHPSRIDLGEVTLARDGEISASVRIKNLGTADLEIPSVQATCGCTFAQAPVRWLESGRECTMRVAVRPGLQPGARESILTIQSNDPVTPMIRIPVTWRAVSSLICEPTELNLGKLRPGQQVEQQISVRTTSEIDVREIQAQTATPGLVVEWEPSARGSHGPGGGRTLLVRFTASSDDQDSAGLIALTGEAAGLATMVPVRWKIVSRLSARPSALFSSGVQPGSEVAARLVLESDDNKPFIIKSVTIDDRRCRYSLDPNTVSGTRALQVDVAAPDRAGAHRLALRIETDLPDGKPVLIPWSMLVR